MKSNQSIKAPGLKYIILMFLFIGLSILIYIYWYFQVSENSKNYLINYKEKLSHQDIKIEWAEIETKGFPYRIEHNINDIKIKFNDHIIESKNIKFINQPWNFRHFLIKLENNINLQNKDQSIKILNENLISSLIIEKDLTKRLSIQSNLLNILFRDISIKLLMPEFHFRSTNKENIEAFISANTLLINDLNSMQIDKITIEADILNTNNLNNQSLISWSIMNGGIDIKNFTFIINNNPLYFNGFLGLDKNSEILSSISLKGQGVEDLLKIMKKKNIINSDIYKASNLIIKTINISSKLIDKEPTYSLNSQNGELYFMNIKLLKLVDLKKYFLN